MRNSSKEAAEYHENNSKTTPNSSDVGADNGSQGDRQDVQEKHESTTERGCIESSSNNDKCDTAQSLYTSCSSTSHSAHYMRHVCLISIRVFNAHLKMCIKRSIIDAKSGQKLQTALDEIHSALLNHPSSVSLNGTTAYDAVKDLVFQKVGDIAHMLYIAHSPQEHEVTVVRMWMREYLETLDTDLQALQLTLLERAECNTKIVMPSYCHGHSFQPVSLGHYLMSYVDVIDRDRERIANAKSIVDRSPMGAYMVAGSSFDINRKMVARTLGFDKVLSNSMDAIFNVDFIVDFTLIFAICCTHLATIAQDLIQWSSEHKGFIFFHDEDVQHKSHISCNCKHHQMMEYVRSKAGLAVGNLMHTFVTLKGLESNFSQDLVELMEPVFRDNDVFLNCIHILSTLISHFKVNKRRTKESSQSPYGFTPDILNWLLRHAKLPYARAVEVTQMILEYAVRTDTKLSLIDLDVLRGFDPAIDDNIYSVLVASRAVISRRSEGGSNPVHTKKAIKHYRRIINRDSAKTQQDNKYSHQ